jgi:ELWxxDGT repeat protein
MTKSFGVALALLLLEMGNAVAAEEGTCRNQTILFGVFNGPQLLWRTDGTTAGTNVIAVNGLAAAGPRHFTQLGTKVLFEACRPNKCGLWQTDGTAAGTTEIQVNNANANGLDPQELISFKGSVLLRGRNASGQYGLWETDGTTAGTKEILPGLFSGMYSAFFAELNGKVLFRGMNRTGHYGLWRTDGTASGTVEIPVSGVPNNWEPLYFTPLNGKVLFGGLGDLWQTDGTSAGTTKIAGVGASSFGPFNGKLLFDGYASGNHGLWETDGTSVGTREIHVSGASPDFQPGYFSPVLNGNSIFTGKNAAGKRSLWRTDGTPAGTVEIPVPVISGGMGFTAALFAPVKGYLVFVGSDGSSTGSGLWRTDGTLAGTVQVPVSGYNTPNHPTLDIEDMASVHFGPC